VAALQLRGGHVVTVSVPDVNRQVTLLDLLDRLLDKGVVLSGEIVLTVADVDLVYVSLRALVSSVDTAMGAQ
jgi:gas vesicle structural protein